MHVFDLCFAMQRRLRSMALNAQRSWPNFFGISGIKQNNTKTTTITTTTATTKQKRCMHASYPATKYFNTYTIH